MTRILLLVSLIIRLQHTAAQLWLDGPGESKRKCLNCNIRLKGLRFPSALLASTPQPPLLTQADARRHARALGKCNHRSSIARCCFWLPGDGAPRGPSFPWTKVADRPGTRSQSEVTLKPACHSKHAMAHMQNPQDMWTRSLSHVKLLRQSHRVRCEPPPPHCLPACPSPQHKHASSRYRRCCTPPLPAGPDQPRSP